MIHEQFHSRMSSSASARDAIVWLRNVTKWIGPGFHPDTLAADYVRVDSGVAIFTTEQSSDFDDDIDRCSQLLNSRGRNIYDVAIKVQRRLIGRAFAQA